MTSGRKTMYTAEERRAMHLARKKKNNPVSNARKKERRLALLNATLERK